MNILLAVVSLMILTYSVCFAEPYLAIREGLRCSSCHLNQTGGGQRNRMGAGYGALDLPWQKMDLTQKKIPHYWSFLDDLIAIGGDFRVLNRSTFRQDNDTNTFQTEKSNLYLSLNLIPDMFSLYLDESVAPGGAQSREIFGLFRWSEKGWLKAGKFVLPYGLRLEDDRAFIRAIPGFTFAGPDVGAEAGFQPGQWSFIASVTNGNPGELDTNTSKQVVGSVSFTADRYRIGLSGSHNSTDSGNKNSAALWGGLRLGAVVLLGEAGWIRDETDPFADRCQWVSYAEIDYLLTEGWNLKAAYEYFDPDRDNEEDERDRVIVGIEPFLYPFLQFQIFYRFHPGSAENELQDADELTFRLHLYF